MQHGLRGTRQAESHAQHLAAEGLEGANADIHLLDCAPRQVQSKAPPTKTRTEVDAVRESAELEVLRTKARKTQQVAIKQSAQMALGDPCAF